jgi:hypothetical protein
MSIEKKLFIRDILNKFKNNILTEFPVTIDWTDDELLLNQMIDDLELYILRYIEKRDESQV